jgi:hypothetical protein
VRQPVVRPHQLGVAQQVPQLGSDARLAGVRPCLLVRSGKGDVRGEKGFHRHRGGDARGSEQPLGAE